MHELKVIAAVAATIVALVAYIPYVVDMFRGKNQPHLYTWISTLLVTGVVAYLQIIGGAGVGAIPTILGVGVDAVIVICCFRFGTKDIVFMDKFCLALSIVGIVAYLIFHRYPGLALVVVTTAEVISFVPTFRKTRNDPYSESLPSYFLLLLKLTLILVALEEYNWLTASYSVLWLAIITTFLSFAYHWRADWHGKPKPATEEAPLI